MIGRSFELHGEVVRKPQHHAIEHGNLVIFQFRLMSQMFINDEILILCVHSTEVRFLFISIIQILSLSLLSVLKS